MYSVSEARIFLSVPSGSVAETRMVSHVFIRQQHYVPTLHTGSNDNDGCDRVCQTEIVLKILKPSRAVLMTAPGIWGCQWTSLTSF